MNNSIRALFLMLIFLGFNLPSYAQGEFTELKKLSKSADIIVTGKVTAKKSGWNENKTRIYTKTTLQVDEYLKGTDNGNFVEVLSPGGEVDGIGEIYTHMPKFEDNEEVLVFLKKDEKNKEFSVLNGEEGKIKVMSDAKTKEKVTGSKIRIEDIKSQIKSFVEEK